MGDIFVSIGGRGIAFMLVSTNVFFYGPESDSKNSWNDAQEALAQIDKDLEFLGVTG